MEMKQLHFSTGKTILHILIYFLLFLAGDLLSSIPFDLLFSFVKLPIRELYPIIRMTSCLLFTVFLFWLYTTKVLHVKMKDFGITCVIKRWGILSALLLPAFVVIIYLLLGDTTVYDMSFLKIFFIIVASLITACKAGILEEMLFRGYIMKLLEQRWNKTIAILLPSFLFSLVHIPSMESFSLTGVLCLVVSGTLVGVMFSLAAYQENSIGNSVLLHAAWNFMIVTDILHITTLSQTYGAPIVSIIIPSDNLFITGGGFGIESSIIAILGYAAVCGYLLLSKRKKA